MNKDDLKAILVMITPLFAVAVAAVIGKVIL